MQAAPQPGFFVPTVPLDNIFVKGLSSFLGNFAPGSYDWLISFIFWFKFASTYISLAFFAGIIIVVYKMTVFEHQKAKKEATELIKSKQMSSVELRQRNWQRVINHVQSLNPNDWRLAILDADVLLDEMLEEKGYNQETLGEKLMAVATGDLPELDKAWEAHKVRNLIAHEGSGFELTQREAERVIKLYESAFKSAQFL